MQKKTQEEHPMNETLKVMQNHRSIRSYQDKEIPEAVLQELLKSIQSMPTSINAQQVSLVVVRDAETRKQIAELAGGQGWIAQAPVFITFVIDLHKTSLAGEKTGEPQVIHGSTEGMLVGAFDAGIALGGAIVAAESLGLGIVPIGGIRRNPEEMIRLLELPKNTFPVAGLVVGYPEDLSAKKPRMPQEAFVHYETYQNDSLPELIDRYDDIMTLYYAERGDKASNWSGQVAGTYKFVYYPKVHPVAKEQGFTNDK